MVKGTLTGGVKPMEIAGRYVRERERLAGMTDAERAFRKQWLKDQELSPNEPRHVPEMYKARYNPIRRFYRYPLDTIAKAIEPTIGSNATWWFRYFSGKAVLGIFGAYAVTYYFMYNKNNWTRKGGWKVLESRVAFLEGDPGYPRLSDKSKGSDYATKGFNDVKLKL